MSTSSWPYIWRKKQECEPKRTFTTWIISSAFPSKLSREDKSRVTTWTNYFVQDDPDTGAWCIPWLGFHLQQLLAPPWVDPKLLLCEQQSPPCVGLSTQLNVLRVDFQTTWPPPCGAPQPTPSQSHCWHLSPKPPRLQLLSQSRKHGRLHLISQLSATSKPQPCEKTHDVIKFAL